MRPTFPPPYSIADWIKEIREAVGLDQVEFGKKFGVSQSSIARWESGEAVPEYPRLLALQRIDEACLSTKPGLVQPLGKALPEQETRDGSRKIRKGCRRSGSAISHALEPAASGAARFLRPREGWP